MKYIVHDYKNNKINSKLTYFKMEQSLKWNVKCFDLFLQALIIHWWWPVA